MQFVSVVCKTLMSNPQCCSYAFAACKDKLLAPSEILTMCIHSTNETVVAMSAMNSTNETGVAMGAMNLPWRKSENLQRGYPPLYATGQSSVALIQNQTARISQELIYCADSRNTFQSKLMQICVCSMRICLYVENN